MAWDDITNAEIDQDSPITVTLMTKYRDNLLSALANDDADTPLWHGGLRKPFTDGITGDLSAGVSAIDLPLSTTAKWHQVVFDIDVTADNSYTGVTLSSDGGSSFRTTGYQFVTQCESGTGSSSTSASSMQITSNDAASDMGNAATEGASGIINIVAADNSSRFTRIFGQVTYQDTSGNVETSSFWGFSTSSTQDDYLRIVQSSGSIHGSSFAMVLSHEED